MGKGAAAAKTIEGDSAFARALASSDYHTREKGWKALQIWLQKRSQLTLDEVMKIWRGILFCFWHSDKAHVQQGLATQLANIMCTLPFEVAIVYFEGFLATMAREWPSIDKLRLDKFMMLVRAFIHSAFTLLQEHKWDNELTTQVSQKILTQSFKADDAAQPIGFGLHLADLFISELETCCKTSDCAVLPHATAVMLLHPFLEVLQQSQQPTLIARIKLRVFEELASKMEEGTDADEQNPFALVDRKKLGQALFACGARDQVKSRNRQVLYELAELYSRQRKSKKRAWAASEPLKILSSDADLQHSAPGGTEQVVRGDQMAPVNDSGGAAQLNSSPDARQSKKQKKSDMSVTLKKKKQQQSEPPTQPEQQSPGSKTKDDASPSLLISSPKDGKVLKSSPKAASGPASQTVQNRAAAKAAGVVVAPLGQSLGTAVRELQSRQAATTLLQQGEKKKKRSRKDRKLRALGAASGAGQAAAAAAKSGTGRSEQQGHQNGNSSGLTPAATAMLADAVNKAASQSPKKRISFNLAKNVYHAVGKPIPPPEIRTPPSARPSGSALKTGSSVMGKRKFKTAAARKLVY